MVGLARWGALTLLRVDLNESWMLVFESLNAYTWCLSWKCVTITYFLFAYRSMFMGACRYGTFLSHLALFNCTLPEMCSHTPTNIHYSSQILWPLQNEILEKLIGTFVCKGMLMSVWIWWARWLVNALCSLIAWHGNSFWRKIMPFWHHTWYTSRILLAS